MIENIKKSIFAGVLIGFGVIINLKLDDPIIGALLFSFGLLVIINMKLNLYTGKIGYFSELHEIKFLFLVILFNFIGIYLTIGLYSIGNNNFIEIISNAAAIKFSKSILTLFLNACYCGALIHIAVKNKTTIITIFAIMIFILIGAEHCIADFSYFLFNMTPMNILKLISIILGNSIGAILIERLDN